MLADISVADVLVSDVVTIEPDASVRAATKRLAERDVGSLVVADDDGAPVGILTNSDVVDVVASGADPDRTTVEDRMSAPLETIASDATLEDAARRLLELDVKRLPVVDDGELRGIVTVTDLSYYLPALAVGPREGRQLPSPSPEISYEQADWEATVDAEEETSVGDTVRFTKRLGEDDVTAFARASGDTNRLHLDDGFAVGTRFGGRIAHGTLVAGVISAALARLPGLTIYLSQNLRFRGPVPIGATVTAVCEVTEALGGSRYRVSTAVYCGDDLVIDGEATVLIDRLHEAVALPPADVEA